MNAIQEQYGKLCDRIRDAKKRNQWGLVRNLLDEQEQMKPALQASLVNTPLPPSLKKVAAAAAETTTPTKKATVTTTEKNKKLQRCLAAFDYYLIPLSQNLAVLLDQVWTRWKAHHRFRQAVPAERMQAYRAMLDGIVLNLLYTRLSGLDGVRISRDKARLNRKSFTTRYKPEAYTEGLLMILDDLDEMGVLKQMLGERWKADYKKFFGGSGTAKYIAQHAKQTVLLHDTQPLTDLLATYPLAEGVKSVGFARERQEVIVVKKDESSVWIEYPETDETINYRRQLRQINDWLAEAGTLTTPDSGLDDRKRFLVRKFTYGSLHSGGRMWGGFWMGLKKELRPNVLRIKGERTVEVDYSCILPRLAYALEGVQPPAGDLYAIPGLSAASRPGIKKVMSALLFVDKPCTKFPKGTRELFAPEDQLKGFSEILNAILQRHAPLAAVVSKGRGHYLQFVESQIMVKALWMMSSQAELPAALPIHDCVIVREEDVLKAKSIMEFVSLHLTGQIVPVAVKEQGKDVEDLEGMDEGLLGEMLGEEQGQEVA